MTLGVRTKCNIYCTMERIKFIVVFMLIIGLMSIIKVFTPDLLNMMGSVIEYLNTLYLYQSIPILFMLYVLCNAPTMLPTNILHVTCGIMFGLLWGFWVALCCYTISVVIPFECTRRCFKMKVQEYLKESPYYHLITIINERPIFLLLCSRASPIIPGSLNNLLFGLTEIDVVMYSLFSAIGIAPQIAFFTYIGSIISNMSEFHQEAKSNLILLTIGIVSSMCMLMYITIKANSVIQDLKKKKINCGDTMLEVNNSEYAV